MRASVKVDAAHVVAALHELAARLPDQTDALQRIGTEGVEAAVPFVPVLTGALVDDLRAEVIDGEQVLIRAGEHVDYAAPQNAGVPSRNIPATHFLDRAQAYLEDHAADDVEASINQLIRASGF